jgi:hypothetical protein
MKATVTVEVKFDPEEPEFCGEDCKFYMDADRTTDFGDDFCWLFGKSLDYSKQPGVFFPLRCKECLRLKETKK